MLKLISHPHLDQFHFLFVSHLLCLFVNQPTGEGGIVKEEEIYRGRKSNQEPFHVPTTSPRNDFIIPCQLIPINLLTPTQSFGSSSSHKILGAFIRSFAAPLLVSLLLPWIQER